MKIEISQPYIDWKTNYWTQSDSSFLYFSHFSFNHFLNFLIIFSIFWCLLLLCLRLDPPLFLLPKFLPISLLHLCFKSLTHWSVLFLHSHGVPAMVFDRSLLAELLFGMFPVTGMMSKTERLFLSFLQAGPQSTFDTKAFRKIEIMKTAFILIYSF